ncbi:FtsX-like permease family protein [Chitinophaga agrisoli]|uniref:FtsX-like permease family protein n=1 Tax=Chitinophaga agrisoli TaxID=2607653 RepID=A0A5B2VJ82_9BACT|nr:ABC transporter permease [Chitinophaga agrisoli]KAA2238728.1 FtsX-like permease family protein [Chitinophaga agrisoli]
MLKNYFRTALRGLRKHKAHSFINITGLAVGMGVAMLIGLWVWDELSFDRYHGNYDRIAQVMQHRTVNGNIGTGAAIPLPLHAAMREQYGSDFKHIVVSSWADSHVLSAGEKKVSYRGSYMGSDAPEMLGLQMLKGSRKGLQGPSGLLISQSVATALFGAADPSGKMVRIDNKAGFLVSGVYEDLPRNTTLHNLDFIAPWDYYINSEDWLARAATDWTDDYFLLYVQITDHADMDRVSEKISHIMRGKAPGEAGLQTEIFLQPMRKWHLFSSFKNGINKGGAVQYVWLFGILGLFVLLLACINFMNLSTARSEKRAKEVGIRKAIGSLRMQLVGQFYAESLLVAVLAFILSLLMVALTLPLFNQLVGKDMFIRWGSPLFWLICIGFTLFTGVIAGSYPALYLSSFRPVKVLKGTFKAGRFAATPRRVLVVMQFTVSAVLIIGTMIVFKQVQFVKDRPVGYSRDGLLQIATSSNELHDHFNALQADLLQSGAVTAIAESSSPVTGVNNQRSDVSWKGKDPNMSVEFNNIRVTTDYGKAIGWQLAAGRDFSAAFRTDSTAVILNEAAVKYMGLKDPVGQVLRVGKRELSVIGVVKDMVMQSPYDPMKQTLFFISPDNEGYINLRINPKLSTHAALRKIEAACKIYAPASPFSYRFADDEYAKKFSNEERTGKLAGCFAILAIFISCLGLFGMASFMAEQRFKEIGVRKVMGASVFNVWCLLSKDFIVLVTIALGIAAPLAYYSMDTWLQRYNYHVALPWWAFVITAAGIVLMTILTVSYQSIKAALMDPVKSLRLE